MKLLAIIFAIVAIVYGEQLTIIQPCPTICTLEYNAVCGIGYYGGKVEWNTYENPCSFKARNCQNKAKPYYAITGIQECTEIFPTRSSSTTFIWDPLLEKFPETEIIAGPYYDNAAKYVKE